MERATLFHALYGYHLEGLTTCGLQNAGRPSDPAQIILLTLAINYVSEVREERSPCGVPSF